MKEQEKYEVALLSEVPNLATQTSHQVLQLKDVTLHKKQNYKLPWRETKTE